MRNPIRNAERVPQLASARVLLGSQSVPDASVQLGTGTRKSTPGVAPQRLYPTRTREDWQGKLGSPRRHQEPHDGARQPHNPPFQKVLPSFGGADDPIEHLPVCLRLAPAVRASLGNKTCRALGDEKREYHV